MRNVSGFFNKERLIKHIVEVNIYYQRYRDKKKIKKGKNNRSKESSRRLE